MLLLSPSALLAVQEKKKKGKRKTPQKNKLFKAFNNVSWKSC